MWKCEPMKKQQGIEHIIKCIKSLHADPKVRSEETRTSTLQFSQKRTRMLTTGCSLLPHPEPKPES